MRAPTPCSRLPLAAACAALLLSRLVVLSDAFSCSGGRPSNSRSPGLHLRSAASSSSTEETATSATIGDQHEIEPRGDPTTELFHDFATFLQSTQHSIISQLESVVESGSGQTFSEDRWGGLSNRTYSDPPLTSSTTTSGGITRVIQDGDVIEKGACSLTIIPNGKLTADRAAAISGRKNDRPANHKNVREGDQFSAAALSIVLHTRSPLVPTFRSDVRIFLVRSSAGAEGGDGDEEEDGDGDGGDDDGTTAVAWFGGGADLTPYYLFDDDITEFHGKQKELCDAYFPPTGDDGDGGQLADDAFTYATMKRNCDDYFFLPARQEHRGVGGTFYDDMPATEHTLAFTKAMAESWLPSWLPIVERRKDMAYTDRQREWQLLRRGRYLEFNLLYDRGVRFGLAGAHPRVEGVMVSAPPLIAWEYNHVIEEGSEEERLMTILKEPIDWA